MSLMIFGSILDRFYFLFSHAHQKIYPSARNAPVLSTETGK